MIMKKNDYETLLFEQKHGIQTDEVQIDDQLDQDAQVTMVTILVIWCFITVPYSSQNTPNYQFGNILSI